MSLSEGQGSRPHTDADPAGPEAPDRELAPVTRGGHPSATATRASNDRLGESRRGLGLDLPGAVPQAALLHRMNRMEATLAQVAASLGTLQEDGARTARTGAAAAAGAGIAGSPRSRSSSDAGRPHAPSGTNLPSPVQRTASGLGHPSGAFIPGVVLGGGNVPLTSRERPTPQVGGSPLAPGASTAR